MLIAARRWTTTFLIVAGSGFALYTGAVGPFSAPVQRGFFMLFMFPLLFLLVPSKLLKNESIAELVSGFVLAGLSAGVMIWLLADYDRLYANMSIGSLDVWIGAIGIALVLEAVRRTVGLGITVVLIIFLEFAYLGPQIPIASLRHGGLDLESLVSTIFYSTDGVFGTPLGVCATFIVLIIMLGALLKATGGAELFMSLATAITGNSVGGPAKIAVVASACMGMITGATVANVATTGSVTIPMMKRAGYDPRFAAAVEALASSGGQLMPPIMGAAAFVMVEYLSISYVQLLRHALVPALLFFLAVLMIVHVRSAKLGFERRPRGRTASIANDLKQRGHMLIPIVVLVVLLALRFGIMYACFLAVCSAIGVAMVRPATRLTFAGFYRALQETMESMCPLAAICAGAGILIGALTATGLSLRLTYLIEYVADGSLLVTLLLTMIACVVLGMGLPTVAAYVVLATLVPGLLIDLGVPAVAAHLFIFYFAILSAITPPVCTGAYVAAGIANADPMQTGFTAMKLGLVVFLLPFAFVYEPSLLLIGSVGEIAIHLGTCAVGLAFWVFGLEGWFRQELGAATRVLLVISGVMLIWPVPWVSAAGLVIGGLALLMTLRPRSWSNTAPMDAT